MKNLFICFLTLVAINSYAAPGIPSTIPSVTVGGHVFTDLTNLIVLIGQGSGGTRTTFRKMGSTSGYTPSGSKTFRALAMKITNGSGTSGQISLAYSDNDVGVASATAFTNEVSLFGSASNRMSSGATVGNIQEYPIDATMPNGKFLGLHDSGAGEQDVIIYGYEQ